MSVQVPGVGEQANKKLCMIEGTQPVCEEDDDIDRISSLPRDVIDCILELMPVQDAARTCLLSSKWRYIWADHPTLIVDKKFSCDLKEKRSSKVGVDFIVDTINRIFLHHTGHINKSVIDISNARSQRHSDVDLWLSFLSKRGVRVLTLENSGSTPYTVPPCVFSNSDLTNLSISNCILKTVKSSPTLYKLESLNLENITLSSFGLVTPLLSSLTIKSCSFIDDCNICVTQLVSLSISDSIFTTGKSLHKLESLNLENLPLPSCVLETPLLSSLTINSCLGIHDFIISAPRLVSLMLTDNDDLNLVPYLECSDIQSAYISVDKKFERQGDGESMNLLKLLSCWPKISKFLMDGSSLKYLATGTIPQDFPTMLSLTRFVPFFISLDLNQISWILCILQNSPLLQRFEIWFPTDVTKDLDEVICLEEANIINPRLEQLRVVKMKNFRASKAELLFMKILLGNAPSLEKLFVEEYKNLDYMWMSKMLMRIPRASPKARIFFGPNLVPV